MSLKICAGVLAAALALLALGRMWLDWSGPALDLGWGEQLGILCLAILAIALMPPRWRALPLSWRCSGSALIEAPLDEIWDRVLPAPGAPFYAATVTRVERVAGKPDEMLLHIDGRLLAGIDGAPTAMHVALREVEPGRHLALEYLNAAEFPLFAADVARTRIAITAEGTAYRVTFTEHLVRFRPSALFLLFHLNPARDAARRLKAECEGTPDTSWMGRAMRSMAADGEPADDVVREIHAAGFAAVAFLVALLLGAMWLILRLLAG
jgi:hypothetical protein